MLGTVRTQLASAQTRLAALQVQYASGRQTLARELLDEYESPPPTIVDVVMSSHGFDDLLNQVSDLRTVARRNADTIRTVLGQKRAVAAEAADLTATARRRAQAASAVIVERDQVAQLKLSIVNRKLAAVRARDQNRAQLSDLHKTLTREAAKLDQLAAAAQAASFSGGAPLAPGSCVNTPFVPHGGGAGFFPAPGTNYSEGVEPVLAARLDALGRALGLQLTGISGYRSPQHSVEVGGFADDPHTQGLASDTPGVEGVPEATLERFCLTRPFGGAARGRSHPGALSAAEHSARAAWRVDRADRAPQTRAGRRARRSGPVRGRAPIRASRR